MEKLTVWEEGSTSPAGGGQFTGISQGTIRQIQTEGQSQKTSSREGKRRAETVRD